MARAWHLMSRPQGLPTQENFALKEIDLPPLRIDTSYGYDFAEPIFRLVSATATTAKIGIAGGALASGEATVTLRKGKPTTLVNTADGIRYELKLVGVGG